MAAKLGKSVTATIREALEEKAARRAADVQERIEAILAAPAAIRESMPPEMRMMSSKELVDAIYDQDGLPI